MEPMACGRVQVENLGESTGAVHGSMLVLARTTSIDVFKPYQDVQCDLNWSDPFIILIRSRRGQPIDESVDLFVRRQ